MLDQCEPALRRTISSAAPVPAARPARISGSVLSPPVAGSEPVAEPREPAVPSDDGAVPEPCELELLSGDEPVPVSVEEPAPMPDPVAAAPPASAEAPGRSTALDWDPEVRDRLRFLVWMKRVRAERRAVPVEVGTDA